ncbi:HEAT repeat domain-containing protein [Nocardia sp. NPDC050712]|uniref:HEAT repeat domain-containing protein n=1 Tax=Nocardia sp. NPDC050712 TaxID=3155518 RepID=UPI0033D415E5
MSIERDRRRTFPLLERAADPLISEDEREDAFEELRQLDDHRSLAPLTAMLLDTGRDERIRRGAAEAAGSLDDTTTGEIRRAWWAGGDPLVRQHALRLMRRGEADIVVPIAADDDHPLQIRALRTMEIGFGEAEFTPVLVRALRHRDPEVRQVAADVLLWEEPVAAEDALLAAADGSAIEVATQAIDTLQYYATRQVLRTLADLRADGNEWVRAAAAASFESLLSDFERAASFSDPGAARLREWMRPVHDLVTWTDPEPAEPYSPIEGPPPPSLSEQDLMAVLDDHDLAVIEEVLRENNWSDYDRAARSRLTRALAGHPDPVVRENACAAFGAWAETEELLRLSQDRHRVVRKAAIYHLGEVPPDPAVADHVWRRLPTLTDTRAQEALNTYVVHAPAGQPAERLAELARSDPRETLRYTAIHLLGTLRADTELRGLAPLLHEPPGVTWAVHTALLSTYHEHALPTPPLGHLADVDNLHVQSALADFAPAP